MKLESREEFLQGGSLSNIDDLVVYLNNVLPHYNYSIPAIEKSVGLSKDFLGGKLRNSGYTKIKGKNGLIVSTDEVSTQTITKSTIKPAQTVPAPAKEVIAPAPKVDNSTSEFVSIEQFNGLRDEVAELKALIEALKVVQAPINLDIEPKDEQTSTKTLRVYTSSLEKLEQFCKLYPQYNNYDIISHIIDNFIDNFKAK